MDKKKLIGSPSANFRSVTDLMQTSVLNKEEKLAALYNWKSMCELQKASTSEGMGGERTTPIADVLKAIRELENQN
ncbi:MAG: hypothetical protein M9899_01440 [Bdellovibrionaceae bacterium]|nr:hypothetical protein [Pseudobdellovibrionaceae bacterium]